MYITKLHVKIATAAKFYYVCIYKQPLYSNVQINLKYINQTDAAYAYNYND